MLYTAVEVIGFIRGTSGSFIITPTIALNSILHLASVEISGRYIPAKMVLKPKKPEYIKESKQGYVEIISPFDYILKNLDNCVVVDIPADRREIFGGKNLLEKRRSELFHRYTEDMKEGWRVF